MSSSSPGQAGHVATYLRNPHGAASVHLDALRGIAAVGVCLNHLRDLVLYDYPQIVRPNVMLKIFYLATGLGAEWVMVFFVLSGYLVGGSVLRSFAIERWSWRGYLLNRTTRLYAVLVPALLLGGLLDIGGIHLFGTQGLYGGQSGSHELTFAVQAHLGWKVLTGNYLFLQGFRVPVFGSNGPLWSLANEFWYYLMFPLLVLAVAKRNSVVARLSSAALLVAMYFFVGRAIALYGLIWLMGVAVHFLPPLRMQAVPLRRIVIFAGLLATAAALAWCKNGGDMTRLFMLGAVVAGLIYAVLCCSQSYVPAAYRWSAHVLSRSSYTLYLVHVPFLVFVAEWVGKIRLAPLPAQLLLMLEIFAATMVYAQILWFLFEKRTDALREWLRPMVSPTRKPRLAALPKST